MSEHERKISLYSQLSRKEKDQINAQKRALYHRKKERQDRLFPVGIEDQIRAEENIRSSLITNSDKDDSDDEEHLYSLSHVSHPQDSGCSRLPSTSAECKTCSLHDIPIGTVVGTLMPFPTIQQHSIPPEAFTLPAIRTCQFCGAKKFPHETPKFCCSGGDVSLYQIIIPPELQQLFSGFEPNLSAGPVTSANLSFSYSRRGKDTNDERSEKQVPKNGKASAEQYAEQDPSEWKFFV